MTQAFRTRFETAFSKIADGLQRPRTEKCPDKLWQRIGRLKEKHHCIVQHYQIDRQQVDESRGKAIGLSWGKQPVTGTMLTHPGVYCLCASETEWDAEKL